MKFVTFRGAAECDQLLFGDFGRNDEQCGFLEFFDRFDGLVRDLVRLQQRFELRDVLRRAGVEDADRAGRLDLAAQDAGVLHESVVIILPDRPAAVPQRDAHLVKARRERGHFELDRPGQARLGGEIADLEGRGLRHASGPFRQPWRRRRPDSGNCRCRS
ncbi:MAG: hypothetical protein V8T86_03865 [Victivallis sp.]